jgi:type IV pilus modification protein PilV
MRTPLAARGFTIMEVLAALLVIAFSIIGVAALYSAQAEKDEETDPRAQAAQFAKSIAARIETNAAGRTGYVSAMGVLCDRNAKSTQPQDAAANEAACWEDEVEMSLPSGLGTITRDVSTNPVTYVVAVSWAQPKTGAASYVIRVQPNK